MKVGLSIVSFFWLFILASPAFSITLTERIRAQEKIERVYYNHRIWPDSNHTSKPSFEQMVPRSVIEQKVINSLKKAPSHEILQAEMDRIARTTKDPAMLRELFAALNNDASLIAEILVRALVADHPNIISKSSSQKYRLPEINSGASCEGWEPLNAPNPPSARSEHTAIWTGTEMIVWGGAEQNTGARYDPALNTWTPTSTGANVPSGRSDHTAVWTGSEMIVWGGFDAIPVELNSGGRYDPITDTWIGTSVGASVPDARLNHTAVWTGTEMIVWGGENFGTLNTGGRYNPSTDSWQPTSIGADAAWARSHHTAVWTGQEMIIWGGVQDEYGLNSGGRYNPVTDSWLQLSDIGADLRLDHTAVWTGSEMIIWGGIRNKIYGYPTNTGFRYDPATDTWQPISTIGPPIQRGEHTAVWTGNEMIIWSGNWSSWYRSTADATHLLAMIGKGWLLDRMLH